MNVVTPLSRRKKGHISPFLDTKSLFQTITRQTEESKKMQDLIKATKTYDKYLRRTLNLEINSAKKIYSKINKTLI